MTDWIRPLGSTGLQISAITIGGGPLGSQPQLFGYETPPEQAAELIKEILAGPIRAIDTSNGYSGGESERRIGQGLAAAGGLPDDFLVVTKVDAKDRDYSGARVRASVQESRERLGLDVLPLVHLHDPESYDFELMSGPGGAVEALVALRDEGVIGHIGLAGGPAPQMQRYLDLDVFEVLLMHNRWTLVDRSATKIIENAASRGIGVVNAAVYGGGILAAPRSGSTKYAYRPASAETLAAVSAMAGLCDEYGTDLATAALQFSLRDTRIASTIVGISKPERLGPLITAAAAELPDEFWDRIEELVPGPANWLDH
ncbi:oxidoreductase [Microlunatus endophyticus]|uniref:Oxidoreductase n=1 Tax=Microlunatus endophyticus TaxID=1716077 RepID=A0A917S180_9ACTN|nr:aldo/keto reductase [Microlunatus endophyticus]GGL46380.1 oxidoreductase [Microlunatus endophyticus]